MNCGFGVRVLAATLDRVVEEIRRIQISARRDGFGGRPAWPMIVLRTPKGWTGPREIDGKRTEGSWRSHQVPLGDLQGNPEHVRILERWMRSYRPEELFDDRGAPVAALRELAPRRIGRMNCGFGVRVL